MEQDPTQAMQRNLHHPDDPEGFSHLVPSINWWSSQKKKAHPTHNKNRKG